MRVGATVADAVMSFLASNQSCVATGSLKTSTAEWYEDVPAPGCHYRALLALSAASIVARRAC